MGRLDRKVALISGEASYIHLDFSREQNWRAAVDPVLKTYGQLDILVNKAAILSLMGIEDTDQEDWDHVKVVNARGVFLGTKHTLRAMRSSGGGSIMNISSTVGIVGSPWSVLYCNDACSQHHGWEVYSQIL